MRAAANDQNAFRRTIGAEIDRLIALLDSIDGDCDLEDAGDNEPSLGWTANGLGPLAPVLEHDDREEDGCDYEDGGDTELNGDEGDVSAGQFDGGCGP